MEAKKLAEHAVVLGGSLAGPSARVLAGAYERVTVVDRDHLPESMDARRSNAG